MKHWHYVPANQRKAFDHRRKTTARDRSVRTMSMPP
jgi:hypothetical protein